MFGIVMVEIVREERLVQVGAGREEVGSEEGKKREQMCGDGRE